MKTVANRFECYIFMFVSEIFHVLVVVKVFSMPWCVVKNNKKTLCTVVTVFKIPEHFCYMFVFNLFIFFVRVDRYFYIAKSKQHAQEKNMFTVALIDFYLFKRHFDFRFAWTLKRKKKSNQVIAIAFKMFDILYVF